MKIVAIGDSITYGFPYTPEQSWFDLAAQALGVEYVNCGMNGDTTIGMLIRFGFAVLEHKPSHVIIMGGTNDAYEEVEPDKIISNIKDMVELARENGVVSIIGLPVVCNDLYVERVLAGYREAMRRYALKEGLVCIDFYSALLDKDSGKIKSGLHFDGVHPSEAGYEVMAGAALTTLKELLK